MTTAVTDGASGQSTSGELPDPTAGATTAGRGGTTMAVGDTAAESTSSASSESADDGRPARCGDRTRDAEEDCDDGNRDETDGCLSTCVVPVSCLHIIEELEGVPDGAYRIDRDGDALDVYCDMTTHGGGWTLLAKVNPADMDTTPEDEPVGWFNMVLTQTALTSPDLMSNAPLESHGASNFATLLGPGSLARFEMVAQNDYRTSVDWYKRTDDAATFTRWFGDNDAATEVCLDVDMMQTCSMGTIDATSGACRLVGMHMADYGYDAGWPVHMRLQNDNSSRRGVCSDTSNNQSNAWPDSHSSHWGNALRIWLRE
ncbi:MAG: hypothetical protein JKY37_01775 [Nannocystaceae bacterium]|nr:hypothetical protein [Nannocystaceae bacterium]